VANLAQQPAPSAASGTGPDPGDVSESKNDVGDLAVEMRSMVTPVIGYLELIAQEDEPMTSDRHLNWISTIEKRLEAIQELNDQIARTCAVIRESVSESEAAPPRGPAAPEG
jgi:hypothetical protein